MSLLSVNMIQDIVETFKKTSAQMNQFLKAKRADAEYKKLTDCDLNRKAAPSRLQSHHYFHVFPLSLSLSKLDGSKQHIMQNTDGSKSNSQNIRVKH